MTEKSAFAITRLTASDIDLCRALIAVFGEAFEEADIDLSAQPDASYLANLLANDQFIVLVALKEGVVLGGLTAHVLPKFDQARREIYVYELAVREDYRRRGIATGLLEGLKVIGARINASGMYVQAYPSDLPAVALYTKLGVGEDVFHFDIEVPK